MPRYLIVHDGVVRDVLNKGSALIGTDIDCLFDMVLADESNSYKVGDVIDIQDFAIRHSTPIAMRGSKFIDLKRYSQ